MNTNPPSPPITTSAEHLTAPSDAWHAEPAEAIAAAVGGDTARVLAPADAAARLPRDIAAPTSLIVPLDGSRFARRALPVALHVARMLHADIHLLSAVATPNYVEHREAELAEIPFPPGGRVHRTVLVGPAPADAIHETRRRLKPGLVCMASHGRGRTAALVGSVALDVIARGRDPIIVVGPAFDGHVAGHRLVACVDHSPASQAFVADALEWARLPGLHLTVVAIAELVPEPLRRIPVRRRFGARRRRGCLPLGDHGGRSVMMGTTSTLAPCSSRSVSLKASAGICASTRRRSLRSPHTPVAGSRGSSLGAPPLTSSSPVLSPCSYCRGLRPVCITWRA